MHITSSPAAALQSTVGAAPQLPGKSLQQPKVEQAPSAMPSEKQVAEAKEVREAFGKFVGTTVFGQMMSSMRKTVGEPAYFNGGQAEKVFQSQLDQAMADEMTAQGGSAFSRAMFEQQFPGRAEILRQAEKPQGNASLDQLANLRRR